MNKLIKNNLYSRPVYFIWSKQIAQKYREIINWEICQRIADNQTDDDSGNR